MCSISLLSHSVQVPKLLLQSYQASLPLPAFLKIYSLQLLQNSTSFSFFNQMGRIHKDAAMATKAISVVSSPINTHSPNLTAMAHELQITGQRSGIPGDNILHLSQGSWTPAKTFNVDSKVIGELVRDPVRHLGHNQFAFVSSPPNVHIFWNSNLRIFWNTAENFF